jgi:hypothetical protein
MYVNCKRVREQEAMIPLHLHPIRPRVTTSNTRPAMNTWNLYHVSCSKAKLEPVPSVVPGKEPLRVFHALGAW